MICDPNSSNETEGTAIIGNEALSARTAVRCSGVVKQFGSGEAATVALRGVDLDIHSGELTLLAGPSGCGKTTLISIIAGLLNTTEGEVDVLGQRVSQMGSSRLARFRARNIGFVFQQFNLLPALTAAENVAVPLVINGVFKHGAIRKAKELLDAVGLSDKFNSFPKQLSGGQQQRVAIARALIHEPRLLVCDEPTAALDAQSGQNVMKIIKGVAVNPERAVVVVTHDNRVFQFGDRVITMFV